MNDTERAEWPVRCALCGMGLYRWYYGLRAPMCVRCRDKSGPVLPPALWEIDAQRCSPAARRVWESWAALLRAGSSPLEAVPGAPGSPLYRAGDFLVSDPQGVTLFHGFEPAPEPAGSRRGL